MLNNITLQGRFTKQPEVKTTTGGTNICNFLLASDRGGKDKATDFIPCVAFGKTAEFIAKYFNKGDMTVICGQLQSRNYDAADGSKKTAYEVYVKDVNFCGGASNRGNTEAQRAATAPTVDSDLIVDDSLPDLPFAF